MQREHGRSALRCLVMPDAPGVVALLGLALLLYQGGCAPAPPPQATLSAPVLVDVVRIWDEAPHNAFTDLIRHDGRWYTTFREGARHVHGDNGRIRVLVSEDGRQWRSAAVLAEAGIDLRDPKLSITPDGRLMLLMGGSLYRNEQLITVRPRVTFSPDGQRWMPLQPVLTDGEWLWRVTWHEGRAYGVSYNVFTDADRALKLVTSEDGLHYTEVTPLQVPDRPNETTLRFLADGEMMALVRRNGGNKHAWIGTSRPPYTAWTWQDAGHHIGGPDFLAVPGKGLWAAGRQLGEATETVLGRLGRDGYHPLLTLPSGGDTSYPGLVWHDGLLWMSYYSSHEDKSAIYLARVRLP